MNNLEKIYSEKVYKLIQKNNKEIKKILDNAIKEISQRISISEIKTVDILKPNYIYKINKSLSAQIEGFLEKMTTEINLVISRDVRKFWGIANEKNNELVRLSISGMTIKETIKKEFFQLNIDALNSFLQRTESGLKLSDRIWKIGTKMRQDIEVYLGSGISTGKSAAGISRDIREFLQEPKKLFRRVKVDGVLKLSKAAQEYHPGSGVYRSSYKNALRMAANETNIAYRLADYTRRQQIPFVVGVEVHLSAMHKVDDMCDFLQGSYPKGFIFSGWHPLCMCYTTSKLLNKKEFVDYIKSGKIRSQRYVRTIPKKAETWIDKNKTAISRYKSKPYFIRDNFTNDFQLRKSVLKTSRLKDNFDY